MGYLRPSQLLCNTFHLTIRNTMTSGCQYIVFIPVYAPLIAIHVLYQAMPELASPVQQRHHLPHPSDFFNVGYYHLVFTIRANSMHKRSIKIIYYFSGIRIYYGFTSNICSTTSCTYISHNYLFLKCSTISSTVALRHAKQAPSPLNRSSSHFPTCLLWRPSLSAIITYSSKSFSIITSFINSSVSS